MSLNLPIYPRPETGIYYLHTSLRGKQVKKSLGTKSRAEAIIRALPLFLAIVQQRHQMTIKKYQIDISKGIFQADSPEDHRMLLETLQAFKTSDDVERLAVAPKRSQNASIQATEPSQATGLTIRQTLDKFLLFKKFTQATIDSYKNTIEDFAIYTKNTQITKIMVSDVVNFVEFLLTEKNNSHRTAHNKITVLKTYFNFAISHGYYFGENPTKNQTILSKKQLEKSKYSIFSDDEIIQLFTSEQFKIRTEKDKDFYYACLLSLITGLRVGEITVLKKHHLKNRDGINYIKVVKSKTSAGIRDVALPDCQFITDFLNYAKNSTQPENKVFRYREIEGKGAGNALGKKFARLLQETNTHRDKLVFHSLRKFFNDFMKRHGIGWEMRTQQLGHENDDINNKIYSNEYTIEQMKEAIEPLQQKIFLLIA